MKKQYINPTMEVVKLNTTCNILAGSGTSTGSTVGNAYNSSDVSYGRENDDWDE